MKFPKVSATPNDPLLLDRWVDVAFAVLWGIYALWALAASILGIATITGHVGPLYNFVWSVSVGFFATVSCLAATSLFFDLGSRLRPPFKKRIELWGVRTMGCLITVYPVLLFISAFGGDGNRFPSAILATSYLVFPLLRVYVLKKRIATFERAQTEIASNGSH